MLKIGQFVVWYVKYLCEFFQIFQVGFWVDSTDRWQETNAINSHDKHLWFLFINLLNNLLSENSKILSINSLILRVFVWIFSDF